MQCTMRRLDVSTVNYTTTLNFLYYDCLYFIWHAIKNAVSSYPDWSGNESCKYSRFLWAVDGSVISILFALHFLHLVSLYSASKAS